MATWLHFIHKKKRKIIGNGAVFMKISNDKLGLGLYLVLYGERYKVVGKS